MDEATAPIQVVQAFSDAFNARDVNAFVALLAEDVVHEDDAKPTMRGKAEVYKSYQVAFTRDTEQHSLLIARMALGSYVIDQEYVTGRPVGPFKTMVLYRVENDKINYMRILREK